MKWHESTSREIEQLVRRDPVVILPIAAIEQHGPHLPLSTDIDIGRGILDAALEDIGDAVPVVTLPMQAVGVSREHVGHAGTITLSPASLDDTLLSIATSLRDSGVRRLVVSNSHGGNKAVLDTAALRIRYELGMLVVKANYFRFPRPDDVLLPESEWTHGLHGGAVETAMMMHLRPERVREDLVRSFPSLGEDLEDRLTWIRPEGPAPFAWLARDLNPDGVVGNATLATEAMGGRLVRHYAAILADVIRDAHAFPLERLDGGAG